MKIKINNVFYLLFLALPVIPLYNRMLTHARVDRYSFNFKTLFVEYVFVGVLLFLLLILKYKYKKNFYDKSVIRVFLFTGLIVVSTIFSVILSWDVYRSIYLFMFGIIGPFILFILIAFYSEPNVQTLDKIFKAFLHSSILYLVIALLFTLRTLSFSSGFDLLEFRTGGNIYASNATIGAITFLLPLIFTRSGYQIQDLHKKDVYLKLFSMLAIIWIILSVSRWGFATLLFGYLSTIFFIEKKINYKAVLGITVAFIIASLFIGNIFQIIIDRFTGGDELQFETVLEHTQDEIRFVRWANAINYIQENIFFGIGLGNNYLIDVRQSPSAHNVLINFSVERGLVTLLMLFGLVSSVVSLNKKIQKRSIYTGLKKQSYILTIGIIIFFFWSLTAGSFVQSGGIISAVKAYYFMISVAILVLISRVDGELQKYGI